MTHKNFAAQFAALIGALCMAMPWFAHAQATASDDFTKANDTNSWKTFGGACLTAGDGTGSIPACVGLPYYQNQIQVGGSKGYLGQATAPASGAAGVQTPDAAGSGALRLTNGFTSGTSGFMYGYLQAGAIISSGPAFNNSAGVNIIFKTVTYLGNSGNGDGADGIGFFLMDGSKSPYDVGAFGGSLGYSCSNTNNDSTTRADGTVRGYDGLAYGYLGLGMDEYGNFLNAADNTVTGPNQTPGRIGLRGAGSISWAQISSGTYSGYYPSGYFSGASNQANRAAAVQKVCSTGRLWDYSSSLTDPNQGPTIADYGAISGGSVILSSILPGKQIAAESATIRTGTGSNAATPITYNLKITQNGLLSLSMAYGNGAYIPVITNQDITSTNGTPPATFRFGFAGSTGGSNNVHEVLCFQAAPVNVAGTSVGVNQKEATKVATGTQAYLANYYPSDWTGRVTASDILYDASTKTISISATSNWDAQCNLTGILAGASNACPTTGVVGPVAAQAPLAGGSVSSAAPLNRSLITWSGSAGVGFEWSGSSTITAAQKTTLTQGDATSTTNRLNYLRGDRTNEINTLGVGQFRARNGVLGDIIDSSPTWVGPPNSAYSAVWADKIQTGDTITENSGTQSYSAFITAKQTRLNVVYDGANDGFLHAFRTGSYDAGGNYVNNSTTPNDGQEILAYMPSLVLQNIHNSSNTTQDYSNAAYSHNYFVNATPGTGDLFYNGTWHSWLAGGLGAGGAGFYILDITNPSNFSEANAGSIVIGDWTSSTISCATSCGTHLGSTYGTPVIRRLHDGKWGVIFGNGFGSTACDAGIFIMTVNPSTGAIANTYYLGTGTGTCTNPNGIAYVTPVDIDTDHIVDYVYAGDLLGNVWRFDLTSTSESSWGTTSGSPLFSTASGQPITSKLLVAIQPQTTGSPRLMVEFGTGRKFPLTNTSPVSYATGTQYLYGIWDWNMSSWNSLSSTKLASLTGPQTVSASTLTTQTLTLQSSGILDGSSNTICWAGSTVCGSGNTQFGFSIALPNTNEQVVYSPLLFQNAFLVNTTIPANNSPTSCQITQDGGDTIAISVASGGAIPGFFKNTTDTNASGTSTGGTGTPFMLQAGGQSYLLTQTNAACTGSSCPANPIFNCKTNPNASYCTTSTSTATPTGKRLTWIERR
jgi:type IV pilus assembly protein PilY1